MNQDLLGDVLDQLLMRIETAAEPIVYGRIVQVPDIGLGLHHITNSTLLNHWHKMVKLRGFGPKEYRRSSPGASAVPVQGGAHRPHAFDPSIAGVRGGRQGASTVGRTADVKSERSRDTRNAVTADLEPPVPQKTLSRNPSA